jgi:hypothetical protein
MSGDGKRDGAQALAPSAHPRLYLPSARRPAVFMPLVFRPCRARQPPIYPLKSTSFLRRIRVLREPSHVTSKYPQIVAPKRLTPPSQPEFPKFLAPLRDNRGKKAGTEYPRKPMTQNLATFSSLNNRLPYLCSPRGTHPGTHALGTHFERTQSHFRTLNHSGPVCRLICRSVQITLASPPALH